MGFLHDSVRRRLAALASTSLLTLASVNAFAGPVTIAWDPNPEPEAIGYLVCIGTSPGDRSTVIDVGNASSYTLAPDAVHSTYYVTVAAYAAGARVGPAAPELVAHLNVAPVVHAPGEATGTVGQALSLALSASDENGDPVTFQVSGLPPGLAMNGSSGMIEGVPTAAGIYNTAVTASDPSGDLSTVTFAWSIAPADLAAPSLDIAQPVSGSAFTTSEAFVTVSGTASDDVGVSRVTWAGTSGGGTTAGTTAWSVVVPLKSGANLITITATDAAGHAAARSLSVTYQPPAPPVAASSTTPATPPLMKPLKTQRLDIRSVTANRPAPGTVGSHVTFTAVARGGAAPVEFQWLVYDGRHWTVLRPWAASPTFEWTPPAVNRKYRVRAWARSQGNTKDAPESDAVRTMNYAVTH